jgi:tetratricopeptide (TPR) repeat protein
LTTQKRGIIASAVLAGIAAAAIGGCELSVAGPGAVYAAFHKPDPRSKAYVLLRRHDCLAANSEFSELLATEPNDAQAISGKAEALVCLQKYDDAISQYSRAIQLDPKWFDYLGRGVAYKAKGDQTQAIQNFDAGIAIAPTIPALYVYRGIVLSAQGDASGANADFENVSSLISDSRGGFNRYGWALATSSVAAYRDGPVAVRYATRACELSSWKNANELDTLAAAYAEAGQFKEAIQWQTSALEVGGRNIDRDDFEARLAMYQKREPFRSVDAFAGFF